MLKLTRSQQSKESLQFELPVQTIDVDFEIPEDLKDVKFSNVKMSLGVNTPVLQENAPAIDLTGLNITGLTMPETVFTGETLIVLTRQKPPIC